MFESMVQTTDGYRTMWYPQLPFQR